MTDWLLARAATGAGFGSLEKLAVVVHSAVGGAAPGVGGWWIPGGWVPDPWTVATVWLPDPATIGITAGQTGAFAHLAWGALAWLATA